MSILRPAVIPSYLLRLVIVRVDRARLRILMDPGIDRRKGRYGLLRRLFIAIAGVAGTRRALAEGALGTSFGAADAAGGAWVFWTFCLLCVTSVAGLTHDGGGGVGEINVVRVDIEGE